MIDELFPIEMRVEFIDTTIALPTEALSLHLLRNGIVESDKTWTYSPLPTATAHGALKQGHSLAQF